MPKLFSSFDIREVRFKNRIMMAPMCMDSADNKGRVNGWHIVHYISRAMGGVGLMMLEATAVEKRGRTLDKDLGIWEDDHINGLKFIVDESKKYDTKIGIQLSHAGRKSLLTSEDIISPSAIPFIEGSHVPREMTIEDIKAVINSFKQAAIRAEAAGFDVIEIHAAHGYLINGFLSPLTNKRIDAYGGSPENRVRFLNEIVKAVREVWHKPLFVRISAEDYVEGGNHPEDLAEMLNLLNKEDVDMIDVSSGGVTPTLVKAYPGYQITYSETIKEKTGFSTIGGGLITKPFMAEEIIQNHRADIVFLGRELLRNPNWPFYAKEILK